MLGLIDRSVMYNYDDHWSAMSGDPDGVCIRQFPEFAVPVGIGKLPFSGIDTRFLTPENTDYEVT